MKKYRFIAVLLILLLALLPVSAFAGEKEGITYTAIGDSIAFGIGGKIAEKDPLDCYGYVDMIRDNLVSEYGEENVTFNDFSMSGLTSEMLRTNLAGLIVNHYAMPLGNPINEAVYQKIANSDIITISAVGGELLNVIDELDPEAPNLDELIIGLSGELATAVLEFNRNWTGSDGQPGIYQLLKTINPEEDTEIYVSNLYNVFAWHETLGSNTAIASIIQSINAPINNKIYYFGTTPHNDADFEVADLYSAFAAYDKPEKLIHYKYDTSPKRAVLHPTTKGYELIYNVFNELMD